MTLRSDTGWEKAGYSLLETLVALAIMAMAAAVIVPRAAGTMDQVVAHSVFFDFQRQISDLRRRAFRGETPVMLIAPASLLTPANPGTNDAMLTPGADRMERATISLRSGWTYALSQPLTVDAGGLCDKVVVNLIKDAKIRVHLVENDRACHFTRAW